MATLDLLSGVDIVFTPEQLFPYSRKFYPMEFSLVVSTPAVAFCARKDLLHRLDRRLVEAIAAPEQVIYSNDAFFVACLIPPKSVKWPYFEERRYRDYMDKRESVLANAQGRNSTPYWRVEEGNGNCKALVVGATNMGNVGDDLIAVSVGGWLREVKPDCTVYYSDFRVSRPDLADFDLVIVGGGGIVYVSQFGQNETDNLANYFKIPLWAEELSIPCLVLGVGVQGRREQFFRDPVVRKFLNRSLLAASEIVVRDKSSSEVLGELTGLAIGVLPDLAFTMAAQYPHFRSARAPGAAKSVAFVGEVLAGRVAFFGRLLEREAQDIYAGLAGVELRYFLMSNDDLPHRDRLLQLSAAHGKACTVHDLRALSMREVLDAFREVSGVVTARFHGLLLSIIAGTPVLSVDLSFGKQSVLIRDDFPSMANNLIDETSSTDSILERLRTLVENPSLFLADVAEIESVTSATRGYADILVKWMNREKRAPAGASAGPSFLDWVRGMDEGSEPATEAPLTESAASNGNSQFPRGETRPRITGDLASAPVVQAKRMRPVYSGENRSFVTLESGEYVCVDTNSLDSIDYLLDFGMERHVVPVFRRFAKPNSFILDIGANFGLYTAIGGLIIREHGQLIAFEGNPHTFDYLRRTAYANKLYHNKRMQLVNALVSDQSGSGTLHYLPTELGGASMMRERSPGSISIDVPKVSIDEFLGGDAKVDLVKIDVEGHEPQVLKGMERTLARSPEVRLIIEAFENFIRPVYGDPEKYFDYLQGLGFAVCRIAAGGALELLNKAASGDSYYFLTRSPELDIRRHCESIPIETMHFHPEIKAALLHEGSLHFDRSRHGSLKQDDLFFGPYSNLAPGTYSIRLVGELSGTLKVRLTSHTNLLSAAALSTLEERIALTITEPVDQFEIVVSRTNDLERLTVREIEISRN